MGKMKNRRRSSLRQNKKWTEKEIAAVVDYLLENRDIEQPTAQIYYRKLLAKTKIDAHWELLKWKVRHLKLSFWKAKKMKQLIEDGILKKSEKEKLRKLWPHFDKLKELFDDDKESDVDDKNSGSYPIVYSITTLEDSNGSQIPKIEHEEFFNPNQPPPLVPLRQPYPMQLVESQNDQRETFNQPLFSPLCALQEPDQPQSADSPNHLQVSYDQSILSPLRALEELDQTQSSYFCNASRENSQQSSDSAKVTSSAKQRKRTTPKDVIVTFTTSQELRNTNQRLLLKFEKEKFDKEFQFNKEKFKIEHELRREELELKRSQIEREEKLKILQMECNERIAKYELDLKYKAR